MTTIIEKREERESQSEILRVNPDTFAELLSEIKETNRKLYEFEVTFSLNLSDLNLLEKYDKVEIVVKKVDDVGSKVSSNSRDVNYEDQKNYFRDDKERVVDSRMPSDVKDRLFSAFNMAYFKEDTENVLAKQAVLLKPYIQDASLNQYSYVELVAPEFLKSSVKEEKKRKNKPDQEKVDAFANNIIYRVNEDVIDPTVPFNDPDVLRLNSETLDKNLFDFTTDSTASGKPRLYTDMVKYFLRNVSLSPNDYKITKYATQRVIKNLQYVDVKEKLFLQLDASKENLTITFDLYRTNSRTADESLTIPFQISKHIEAYDSVTSPPEVSAQLLTSADSQLRQNQGRTYAVSISDGDRRGKVKSFNLYLKNVFQNGTCSQYQKLKDGSVKNDSTVNLVHVDTNTELSLLRVVPVDSRNRELNVFTNVALGPGYETFGSFCLIASHSGNNMMKIETINLPEGALEVRLLKRDCTDNFDNQFEEVIVQNIASRNTSNITFMDTEVSVGKTYEYYAVCTVQSKNTLQLRKVYSNYAMLKNISTSPLNDAVTVEIKNKTTVINDSGSVDVSFEISTFVPKSKDEKITEFLKQEVGQLYDQYLNTLSTTYNQSPLGDNNSIYSNLFIHEVVRTNLDTGERQVFDLVSNGVFRDDPGTRASSRVTPVDPQNSYTYHVFTYRRNPLTLFPNYIAKGIKDGYEWFYYPYKWKNPKSIEGKLYADDPETGKALIEEHESLTADAFGLTSSVTIDPYYKTRQIQQISANRIDRNTVKLSWQTKNSSLGSSNDDYDCFVVMKVVNGIKSFVGRSHKNYIYHELTTEDIGSVYYIIVPFLRDLDIVEAYYSNNILIEPDGIAEKSKVPETTVSQNNSLRGIPNSNFYDNITEDLSLEMMQKKLINSQRINE